ncbi:MAG: leucine-rich repeat protein, partial [Lachnospiraceae bacterium]|nr:leucine-rich repeat protein [Lachnospiraceae bacterium]
MKKRLLAILLTMSMLVCSVQPVFAEDTAASAEEASAEEAASDEDPGEEVKDEPVCSAGEMYEVEGVTGGRVQFDKSTGTVTWMQKTVTEAVIPEEIDGVKVTAIGDWATPQSESFVRLELPDTVTSVGEGLCQKSGITDVSLPSGISSLPKYCFRYCDFLESVTVPGNVKKLDNCCFQYCKSLKTVTIGAGVAEIGQNSFEGCPALETLSMPSSLKKIGSYAFRSCSRLENVTYDGRSFYPFDGGEDKYVELGDYCFGDCFFGHPDFSDSYKSGRWYKELHKVKPTGDYLTDLFAIAESQMGYHEGNSLKEMDGAHKGNGDYAEYTYWWNEPGHMWCGEYVGWCIAMASMPYEMVHPKYTAMGRDGEKRLYSWDDTVYAEGSAVIELKKGDVILFKYDGGNHIILVESVSKDGNVITVSSLNGNHSNDVSRDDYKINAVTGKTIGVWEDINGYVDTVYSFDFSIAETLTYHTVSFDMQGGTASWDKKKLTNDASYGVMPLPERTGYTFDGWYTERTGGKKITSYRRVSLDSDQTLYARWTDGGGEPEEPEEETDLTGWRFDESTGTITYIPYDWTGGKIPAEINGVAVTAIGDYACSGRK